MQPGDVPVTYADATALERDFGFTPKIPLREGLRKFAEWYAQFYEHEWHELDELVVSIRPSTGGNTYIL